MIVDDEPANVRVLQRLLGRRGYHNVRCTNDPDQVLQIWDDFQPHLLLLDLMMPGCDGIEVISRLRESARFSPVAGPPILVLTADATSHARQVTVSSGARDLITKPFDHDQVMTRIADLLETELGNRPS